MMAPTARAGAYVDKMARFGVSDCVEMHQNGQDENVAFFWHQICCGARLGDSESLAMARDTKKTGPKAIVSLWMPRRKSPLFKLPVMNAPRSKLRGIKPQNPNPQNSSI
jgi:hypothetical protein